MTPQQIKANAPEGADAYHVYNKNITYIKIDCDKIYWWHSALREWREDYLSALPELKPL